MNRKRVTIKDVAKAAGVSRQTVSRAMNNRGEISPETRAKVLRIAEEMDYRPSSIARSLATRRTGTLGLIIPDVANPFFSEVVRGAEHEAYSTGHNVFLCNTDEDPERELAILYSLEELRVDGVILCSSRLDDATLKETLTHHGAVVLLNRLLPSTNVGTVRIDDLHGGQIVTHYLLEAGHTAIGYLAGPIASHSGQERMKGYLTTMQYANIPEPTKWIAHCAPTVQGGRDATRALLNAHPDLTAVFCYNDLVAVGAIQACTELGRVIPDSVAIVGFDDIPLAALVTPALTTCHVPRYDLGRQAMQLLLERIDGCTDQCQMLVVPPSLVVRDSS